MGGELRYEIDQNAYIKLVLHALKHKTAAVNGVLLGRLSGVEAVEITDAVPLFHSHLGLLPPLEIALLQIEEYYGAQGMYIVGYFHANERFNDFELSNVARNIGDHVHRYFPQAALLLLDNKKLEAFTKGEGQEPCDAALYKRFVQELEASGIRWRQPIFHQGAISKYSAVGLYFNSEMAGCR